MNQQLMECSTLEDYHGEEFLGILSKEQPATVRYHGGKKALELCHAYVQVYEKERVWESGAADRIEAGEEGKDYYTRCYRHDYAGNITKARDAVGNETEFCYNGDSRLERIKRTDGSRRFFGYDREGGAVSAEGQGVLDLKFFEINRMF